MQYSDITRFREGGTVQKKKHLSLRAYNKLITPLELTIVHYVLQCPGIYLHEIATELLETIGASLTLLHIFYGLYSSKTKAGKGMTSSGHNLHFLDETGSSVR